MRNRPSVQRTKTQEQGLLRSVTLPRLLALETMSQDVGTVRRGRQVPSSQPHVWVNPLVDRLPILGLRSQRQKVAGRVQRTEKYGVRSLEDPLREVPGTRTICQKRSERRALLFKMGIAGKGKRKSPGQGGTYKRNEESITTCRTYRR